MSQVYFSLPGERQFQHVKGREQHVLEPHAGFIYKPFEEQRSYVIMGEVESLDSLPKLVWPSKGLDQRCLTKQEYLSKLESLIGLLNTTELEKVVFSRRLFHLVEDLQIDSLLVKLRERYPNAFVYALNSERFGVWVGASPETMIIGEGDDFRTVSLAGTKSAGKGDWANKEKEEQKIVTSYINNVLAEFGATQIQLNGPYVINSGPVDHLKTDISFSFSGNILSLLDHISPTPAVCGVPKELALNWITNNESSSRELYGSYIGYFEENKVNTFVNLRSMQVGSNGVRLYVGGGITADSIATDEWNETELKAKTLLDLL